MLDDRKLAILRAIVTDYVSMREPVGSKALVERYRLEVSPATVRNDMAVLEEEGYITQPHTSAGRIPTDKGYRLFVDRLASVKPLSTAERRAIETFMAGALDVDDVVRRTVRLLAQITQQVAIVQYPIDLGSSIRHVEIVTLGYDRALAIVVTSAGRVEQRSIDTGGATEDDVADLRGRLNTALVGLTAQRAAAVIASFVDELPAGLQPLGAVVSAAVLDIIGVERSGRVVVGGVPNLTRFSDQFESTVKPVLEALEEQVVLLRLLGEASGEDDVTVRIGRENPYEALQSTSMVASAYGAAPDGWATLGIVGPTRMDYPSTMAAVRAVARYVGRFLAEG
ncbi:MAG: heat-inducible transcriptional repressor HrcA [Propionicimonas sp.]|uniref:heat-inducible transcriptional repressor HrcA n=1 Tax=Propionicimonas sp. TaxID=1955623 RepID=UPI002B1EFFEE|nr:heat-inducible transcriptional repressor HrcA [Propionicimonas sp.]MEA4943052.1 heat-inducible transcriptional repressor HrcA [Propionicimonas sp.]MEA5052893.1 heat-inducible transcriptional repressor HrcA [Propionicimonas sp.]MEA5118821.1 heat-inducible transcriptional repressor HrcA [Propionicimonas sp.]